MYMARTIFRLGLGQAENPEIRALRSQEENLRTFCRQKAREAGRWAELAKQDPSKYGDVARDAGTHAEECMEEANALRRAISTKVQQILESTSRQQGFAPLQTSPLQHTASMAPSVAPRITTAPVTQPTTTTSMVAPGVVTQGAGSNQCPPDTWWDGLTCRPMRPGIPTGGIPSDQATAQAASFPGLTIGVRYRVVNVS